MVEAIFYVLRTAIAWRDMPACYGPWSSVYTPVGDAGVLWVYGRKLLDLLSRHAVGCVRFVDGSHIKLHQFGTNPAGGQSAQADWTHEGRIEHQAVRTG